MNIEKVIVHCSETGPYMLGCTVEGMRYHVWLNRTDRKLSGSFSDAPTLYKNPPEYIEHRAPGWFPTRHLRIDSKAAIALITAMRQEADKQNMFVKAEERIQEKAETERKENAEYARIRRIQNAGLSLYEALKNLYAQSAPFNYTGDPVWEAVKTQVESAIAEAEGQ